MKAVCRIEKQTRRPAIFFYDEFGKLIAYTREEQHCPASIEYYRERTRLARNFKESSACVRLMQNYRDICISNNISIAWKKRLPPCK